MYTGRSIQIKEADFALALLRLVSFEFGNVEEMWGNIPINHIFSFKKKFFLDGYSKRSINGDCYRFECS